MEKKAILLMFVCCFLYYSQRLFSYYAYSYLLCFLVVIHYCEIPISTKGWPSLKMRGMPTTCVVFFPHQLFLKKLRLIIWPETILSTLIFLFLFSKAIRLCVCLHTTSIYKLLPLYWAGEENDPARTPVSSSIAEVYGNDGSSGVAFCTIIF